MENNTKHELNKAVQIGTTCVSSYLVSYYMRNILSVTTPEMLNAGSLFTKETIGSLSSVAINFWIPTYFTEQLMINQDTAKAVYSGMSFVKSFTPFITLMVFALFKEKDIKMVRFAFLIGTAFIGGMYFVHNPYLNILCLLLAQIALGIASGFFDNGDEYLSNIGLDQRGNEMFVYYRIDTDN